ncbi:MAG: FecR family protein [Flavisolibacter sp.]|nr:FecR family protein [Flavisolibacter sp.]
MDQTLFWNLLAKKIAGEASEEELHQLESLMKQNPDWAYQAEHIQHMWQTTSGDKQESEFAFEQHLQRMKEAGVDLQPELPSINSGIKRDKVKNIFAYSAAAVVVFLIAGFVWLSSNKRNVLSASEKNYSEVSSPFGSKTKLVLPDSTVVWLNAGSKLTYNEHFGITNRNTTLTGEAFFDVKKSTVPFVIRANNIQIKVLGTAFNVKAYPEDKTTETSLIHGRVEVTLDKRPGEPIVLKPNEKLIVVNEKAEAKVEQKKDPKIVIDELTRINDTTIVETSWVRNELIFQDETFSDIARKMERWYGFTIEIRDEEIASERLSGTFTTETIQEALTALQYSTKFHYSIKGKQVTITQ